MDGIDWPQAMRDLRRLCPRVEVTDLGNQSLRSISHASYPYECAVEGVALAVSLMKEVVSQRADYLPQCYNAIATAGGIVAIMHPTLAFRNLGCDISLWTIRALVKEALEHSYLLDASHWPMLAVYGQTILQHAYYDGFKFEHAVSDGAHPFADVSFLIPEGCPSLRFLMTLFERFPESAVVLQRGGCQEEDEIVAQRERWKVVYGYEGAPSGRVLNNMIRSGLVSTPFVFIVTGSMLPRSRDSLKLMIDTLSTTKVGFVGGPSIDKGNVYVDYSYKLRTEHWHLSFDPTYTWSFQPVPDGIEDSAPVVEYDN
ncbi:hypothetical protein FOL47_004816 [Perkinsus chesapeaki]|uniref:Uncharacterized protein n=1 Tax=Perkinsus chesapeaki TaxID=330153 RepID=A0A7J6M0N9_PERCH|nr:hypothetical protein FOL47_004816 [Perkinsus chesapeaki]